MAGGTGGHVFPALAVAQELRARGHHIYWLGTQHGLEAEVVPREGFVIHFVEVQGLRGKGLLGWVLAPWRLLRALIQALKICRRIHPNVVVGMGGFVTGPGGVASWLLRRPLIIHEQNAIPGMTNRWLARIATRVLQAFADSFATSRQAHTTGNPVRQTISQVLPPQQRYAARQGTLRVLVVGGSLGAHALNETVPAAIAAFETVLRPLVRHQSGKHKQPATQQRYADLQVNAEVTAFITDMAEAYAWADLVICRAGAMTIAELCNAGLAAILVPFPHAVDDHQTANAKVLTSRNAAILIPQHELSVSRLSAVLAELFRPGRARLQAMAEAAYRLATPEATQVVAQHCLEVARV
ncbi:MAG: undecaprenyldiphospho-muramoylpentapeptide beta-N-acetylglucosaminyltransferase [Gammaproteobacteria bacterium]|nr:undecaprenyldiphospho-muramoylpentapeptide beta-N-acetylglucosaminyltransferase [Gammaproteobacteria bacterium]